MAADTSFRRIASRQNAVVGRARALAHGAADDGAVLVEGVTLVAEAAAAGWPLELVAITEAALADPSVSQLVATLDRSTDRVLVTAAVMAAMSPVRSPSGVVAVARPPASGRRRARADTMRLDVCAVGVQDPGNLGAIVRVAEAAGATAVLVAGPSADPFGWKALRGSMGSAFRLPIVRSGNVADAVAEARAASCLVVATVADGVPLDEVDLGGPTFLLVGSEGAGLPAPVVETADVRLAIPMERPVESLNVAVATGIVLYEACRQRSSSRGGRA